MLASRFVALVAATITCASSTGCMVHRLPPPPAPSAELPPNENLDEENAPPTASNKSRVVITTDVPARVTHVADVHRLPTRGGVRKGAVWLNETICERTPCTVTLEYGHQELRFVSLADEHRTSTVIVPIADPRVAVSHTLGQYHSTKGRVVGMLVVLAGAALVGIGLGLDDAPRARAIGIGAAAVVGGGLIWGFSHETAQEGATTQWVPQPTTPPAADNKPKGPVLGTSFGFRF